MKKTRTVYELDDDDKYSSIVPNPDWRHTEGRKTWCTQCTGLKRTRNPQPIDVYVERIPLTCPIGSVGWHPIGIIRNDLRSLLQPWLGRFVFGRCFDDDGRLIVTHSTFYSADYVYRRYGPGSTYKQCSKCGLIWPKKVTTPHCFMEYEFHGHEIIQEHTSSTLISEQILNTLDVRAISGLDMYPRDVLERPIDGVRLPSDPPDVKGNPPEPWSDRYSDRRR